MLSKILFKRKQTKIHVNFTKRNDHVNTFCWSPSQGLEGKLASMQKNSPRAQWPSEETEWKAAISGIWHFCVIGRGKLSCTAPKELRLPKKMQAERDEWLRLADYSYNDLIGQG